MLRMDKSSKEISRRKIFTALVAIRCLDEGLNIPKIKTVHITASNRFERQYIQRVGFKFLRRDHEKKKAIFMISLFFHML